MWSRYDDHGTEAIPTMKTQKHQQKQVQPHEQEKRDPEISTTFAGCFDFSTFRLVENFVPVPVNVNR